MGAYGSQTPCQHLVDPPPFEIVGWWTPLFEISASAPGGGDIFFYLHFAASMNFIRGRGGERLLSLVWWRRG